MQQPVKGLSVHKAVVAKANCPPAPRCRPQVDRERRLPASRRTPARTWSTPPCTRSWARRRCSRGSFNKAGYLRFDFSWGEGLSDAAQSEVEEVSNPAIRNNYEVRPAYAAGPGPRLGAMALFGEAYGDTVRVVEIDGAWSRELCGGTHVEGTAQIGSLTLLGEASVGSGNRRVEAFVGMEAFRHMAAERALVTELSEMLKVPGAQLPERIAATLAKLKSVEKELDKLRKEQLAASAASLVAQARDVAGVRLLAHDVGEPQRRRRPAQPGPGPAGPAGLRAGHGGDDRCSQRPAADPGGYQRGGTRRRA